LAKAGKQFAGNHPATLLPVLLLAMSAGKLRQSSCRQSSATSDDAYSLPVGTIPFAGKRGISTQSIATLATTPMQVAKSLANAWQSYSALG